MFRPAISRRVLGLAVVVAAGAGIGVGTLSGCSTGGGPTVGSVPAAETLPFASPSPAAPSTPAPAAPGPLTPDQASAIAVQASPGTVVEVEQDVESTGPVFDVKIQHADGTETKVQIDANTGQVMSTETDGPDGANDPADVQGDGH